MNSSSCTDFHFPQFCDFGESRLDQQERRSKYPWQHQRGEIGSSNWCASSRRKGLLIPSILSLCFQSLIWTVQFILKYVFSPMIYQLSTYLSTSFDSKSGTFISVDVPLILQHAQLDQAVKPDSAAATSVLDLIGIVMAMILMVPLLSWVWWLNFKMCVALLVPYWETEPSSPVLQRKSSGNYFTGGAMSVTPEQHLIYASTWFAIHFTDLNLSDFLLTLVWPWIFQLFMFWRFHIVLSKSVCYSLRFGMTSIIVVGTYYRFRKYWPLLRGVAK